MNYIIIEFDTTRPDIAVYAPTYTNNETVNVITVESNERLSSFQEFYGIDSAGIRHDYTFEYAGTRYVGRLRFNDVPLGHVTLYARIEDEVGNRSDVASKTLNVVQYVPMLNAETNISSRTAAASLRTLASVESVIHSIQPDAVHRGATHQTAVTSNRLETKISEKGEVQR